MGTEYWKARFQGEQGVAKRKDVVLVGTVRKKVFGTNNITRACATVAKAAAKLDAKANAANGARVASRAVPML